MGYQVAKLYVQYGCGQSAPCEWINFDASPTLRVQGMPVLGSILKSRLNTIFPKNVLYGDIIKGLPIKDNSCDGVYCSHILEHLSLSDFKRALVNTHRILKVGGIFRCVVPDLELAARKYIANLDAGDNYASINFLSDTSLGFLERPRKAVDFISSFLGNSRHLWMWDSASLAEELRKAGFANVRKCNFNDCEDQMFKLVEDLSRFKSALAIECRK